MLLYNPDSDIDSNITWYCDKCNAVISDQEGFKTDCGEWKCKECGYVNPITPEEIYSSEDEFLQAFNSPYRGLSNEDALRLLMYEEVESINNREDIVRVRNLENNRLYVKKLLHLFDESIFRFLKDNPVHHIPQIEDLFLTDNCLIVIEENIEGKTLDEMISEGPISQEWAIDIAKALCLILDELHTMAHPIIHRDIKPSNVIISANKEVFLLDVNAAKWRKKDEIEDTVLLGTLYYAAPEQYGFGYSGSTEKTDVYALGVLINKMITGKFPKEQKASGEIWKIIESCISLYPDTRPNAKELHAALLKI